MSEGTQGGGVGGHRVVREEAGDHGPKPLTLLGDAMVHAAPQLCLNFSKFHAHAVAPGLTLELEGSTSGLTTDEREPQEHERQRFSYPVLLTSDRRIATELQQSGLLLMKLKRKL